MRNRKIVFTILSLLLLLSFILAFVIFSSKNEKFKVIFLNVGQGDSILIFKGPNQILIDGGKDGKLLLEKIGRYIPFWDRKIELLVETHPDQDHIGGLIDLAKAYEIENVLKTDVTGSSQTYQTLESAVENENSQIIKASSGGKIIFPSGGEIEVLYPFAESKFSGSETNSSSVILKANFGENKFLLTGDLPAEQEKELIEKDVDLSAQFLKVGHHGSKYSTSNEFLEAVKPKEAIISVGKNSYGHPNQETIQRLQKHGLKIFRTDEIGDIEYDCENVDLNCQRI